MDVDAFCINGRFSTGIEFACVMSLLHGRGEYSGGALVRNNKDLLCKIYITLTIAINEAINAHNTSTARFVGFFISCEMTILDDFPHNLV
jgi:hypothetical protein